MARSLGVALSAAALLFAVWWFVRTSPPPGLESSAATSPPATLPADPSSAAPAAASSMAVPISAGIEAIRLRLSTEKDPAESRRLLTELRTVLDALPPAIAAREVRSFLASRKDAPTQLDLTVKAGGALGDASSLRVFLLDYLGLIDRTAAASVGREILSTFTSPDEWAVSLRNVAWAGASEENRSYLTSKAREMISHPAWSRNPSAGFLEAFDVIVHARGFELTPQLTALVRDRENRAVAHAAFLTLDRLTLADPAAMLAPLAAEPGLMAGREETRANLFARADVRDARQRELLEGYLLDPSHTARELHTFASVYPNANYMLSRNLLTETNPPAHSELTARDRAALDTVEAWTADPRFAGLQAQLGTIRERLRTFVQQGAAVPEK